MSVSSSSFEPPVVVKTYNTFLTFAPLLYRFPKPYRYTLGQKVEQNFLALLELVFEANSLPRPLREAPLVKAEAKCELLKLLIRLCFELNLLKSTQYFQLTANLQEIARMLGGWIIYVRSGPNKR